MKILLFGANGQVGHALLEPLAALGEVVAATRGGRLADGDACETADFDHPDSLAAVIGRIAPDVVVNAAAYTAVDRAEEELDAAYRVNAEAVGAIANACSARGARLVHYSTDYVFDGSASRPYREDDSTSPLGVYGASKLAGEEAVRASGAHYAILRTAWVYSDWGRNFLLTMLRLGRERDEVRVVDDQCGTPTSARLIAETTCAILPALGGRVGEWHLTASGETSWAGFAREIFRQARALGLSGVRDVNVIPIPSAEYPTPARRPAYSRLDTTRLASDFALQLPEWRADLLRTLGTFDPVG